MICLYKKNFVWDHGAPASFVGLISFQVCKLRPVKTNSNNGSNQQQTTFKEVDQLYMISLMVIG